MVQVRYDEGVAIHIGPEPCVVVREGGGEASAGERIGQPSSRERKTGPGRRRRSHGGRQHGRARDASARPARRGQRPWHVRTLLVREPGDLVCGRRWDSTVRIGKPETFNFLGFTFVCGKSRRGRFLVERKSRRDRMRAKLREIKEELRRRRHQPIPAQGKWLRQVVTGFFAYHAVPTNGRSLGAFRYHVTNLWRRTLRRRSQKDRTTWARVTTLAADWLPRLRILHPWPSQRFAVTHPR